MAREILTANMTPAEAQAAQAQNAQQARNPSPASMQFIFIGDRNEKNGPERINMFGVEFKKGEAVEVTDKAMQKKLMTNQEFATPEAFAAMTPDDKKVRGLAA